MFERMNFRQFALRAGLDPSQVTRAVKTGKIKPHIDENGKKYLFYEEAIAQWEKNIDPVQSTSVSHRYNKLALSGSASEEFPSITESKQRRDHYLAEQEKINFEVLQGSVVRVEDVTKKWGDLVAVVRTKILAVPSKFRQREPDFTHEKFLVLEKLIRESLEELANEQY